MSGPHVFSFSEDGKVVCPETSSAEACPGDRPNAASSTPATSTFFRVPTSVKASTRVDKPWKNVAITEQDDEEFAAMEAEAEMRAWADAKAKLVGLVHTWPPPLRPAPCAECAALLEPRQREVLGTGAGVGMKVSARAGTPESSVPALSYGSSGESESESDVFRVVPGRRVVRRSKELPLEKRVGFGRVERKASAPRSYVLAHAEEHEGARWSGFGAPESEVDDGEVSWSFL